MPSQNKTPNYGLNQWQGNEYPKRQDFVSDNDIIDAELKKSEDEINSHTSDTVSHISVAERQKWNNKVDKIRDKGLSQNDLTNSLKNNYDNYEQTKTNVGDFVAHTSDTTTHITATERGKWNKKADKSDIPSIPTSLPANGGHAKTADYSSRNTSRTTPALRNIKMSTSSPSGGSNGDIWFQYK